MTTTDPTSAVSGQTGLNNYIAQQQAAAAAATAAQAQANSSSGQLTGNLNTFLNILTTQLKNQDPTSATDTNQFTQELVQFAGVEQQLNTNSDLTQLINLQKNSSGLSSVIGYMNNFVEAPSTGQMPLQNGQSEVAYTLPAGVSSVSVTVKDSTGNVVATLTGPTTAGLDRVGWDGKDGNGNQLKDGAYSFSLAATNSAGSPVSVTDIRTVGLVTGVQSNTDGTFSLNLGSGMTISSSKVDAVFSSSAPPQATLGDATSS